jgi:hypothetical protein
LLTAESELPPEAFGGGLRPLIFGVRSQVTAGARARYELATAKVTK